MTKVFKGAMFAMMLVSLSACGGGEPTGDEIIDVVHKDVSEMNRSRSATTQLTYSDIKKIGCSEIDSNNRYTCIYSYRSVLGRYARDGGEYEVKAYFTKIGDVWEREQISRKAIK